ncbi:hypothetical protein BC834DRAFT_841447 [Gloeopeniophorella convolvens]|nr:hypothetical protein BC834DRAFT_841447 [Gloeopeniophorella convolvens]
MPPPGRHSASNSLSVSPPRRSRSDTDIDSSLHRLTVVREEIHCHRRLPLWLLFFGGTASLLTLFYLITGTIYPIPNSWTRGNSQSVRVIKAAEGIYRAGHRPSLPDGAAIRYTFASISRAEPDRVFTRRTRTGDPPIPLGPGRLASSGPALLVDNYLSLLVQIRMPETKEGTHCTVTSGISLTRRLEAAGRSPRVEVWVLAPTAPDMSAHGVPWDARPQREAHVSSFDVRPGELLRSHEFACPPPGTLQMFEVACADGDDACAVEVWQGLFRVEVVS